MSDRADFLAGIAASGCGSMYGIDGDFGTFSGPYPDPSPPHESSGALDHDMSDIHNGSDAENDSISETSKGLMPKKDRKQEERIRLVHRHLNREIDETHQFSEESTQLLARIARIARHDYRSSAEKRLKHFEWAAKTLTAAAFTPYVRMFGVDAEVKRFINRLNPKEKRVKQSPIEASILRSLKNMSGRKNFLELRKLAGEKRGESKETRDNFNEWALTLLDEKWRLKFEQFIKNEPHQDRKMKKKELMRRPLAEVPFNSTERKIVEGLLSLLMRISESVARRPWPQKFRPIKKKTAKRVPKIHREMERKESLLDELRGRIELGWPGHVKTVYAGMHADKDLIKKVEDLSTEVLGISLLPSAACIQHIIDMVKKISSMEARSPADDGCVMPAKFRNKFEHKLRQMDLYDDWRSTKPPDSERFLDFMIMYRGRTS